MDPYAVTWESLVYSDGTVYQGLAMGGEAHGRGALVYSNGDTYQGDFAQGRPEGFGVYKWTEGSSYAGRVRGGHLHGCGRKAYPTNEEEKGEFLDDVFVGTHLSCTTQEAEASAQAGESAASDARALLIKPLEEQVNVALRTTGVQRQPKKRMGFGSMSLEGNTAFSDTVHFCYRSLQKATTHFKPLVLKVSTKSKWECTK